MEQTPRFDAKQWCVALFRVSRDQMPKVVPHPEVRSAIEDFVRDSGGHGRAAKRLGVPRISLYRFLRSGGAMPHNMAIFQQAADRQKAKQKQVETETLTLQDVASFVKVLHHLEGLARSMEPSSTRVGDGGLANDGSSP